MSVILGIETSCDETAASVVQDGSIIRSNVVASSVKIHQQYGGVVPEQAARAQLSSMIPVLHETLQQARVKSVDIDSIAVTFGPGLIGSLLVGVETAKTLAVVWGKPIVPVNHLLAHFYAIPPPPFPWIGLLTSGGHTDLILSKNHGEWEYLGGTRDDAAGEAFDKTGRLLGLPYPGGPAIAKLAEHGNPDAFPVPRPMLDDDSLDFSFSGLKTAVSRIIHDQHLDDQQRADLAASIQEAIVDVLVLKTVRAAQQHKVAHVVVAGGVAANSRLRDKFELEIDLHIPPPTLCTDNAVMVARYAHFNFHPIPWESVDVAPNLSLDRQAI
ncbi:MAG: tRNA (adenosine(37)-N6)-threonylcarbamoyltransferase complex transferase subunit TsaD [bacterium]|nr:tRNA (adenosine(37)-N6)-threonylcarbamoyltransferase complex transferase subunit TsaD [bacterium]